MEEVVNGLNVEAKELIEDLMLMPVENLSETDFKNTLRLVKREMIENEMKELRFSGDIEGAADRLQELTKKLAKLK